MNPPDWIHGAIRVARPAAKLRTHRILDPNSIEPESSVVRRTRPQSPLKRLQEIISFDFPEEERDSRIKEFLETLEEKDLEIVSEAMETMLKVDRDISKANFEAIYKNVGTDKEGVTKYELQE